MAVKKKVTGVDRWTNNGFGIVTSGKNTPEQQKIVDELNAKSSKTTKAAKSAKKKPAAKKKK